VYTAVLRSGGGADPTAAIVAEIPNSHAAVVLERERQQMILMDAASQTLNLVSTPKLATRPSATPSPVASAASGSGSGSSNPVTASEPAPDPGTAQSIAYNMLSSFGWSPSTQYDCLNAMWTRESNWIYNAENASGAYGIPQALPGSKMASAGPDWQTDPTTQIKWGLGYIQGRYGSPCAAWAFWQANGWY
jgi:resuscitation-promoting factor RpfB